MTDGMMMGFAANTPHPHHYTTGFFPNRRLVEADIWLKLKIYLRTRGIESCSTEIGRTLRHLTAGTVKKISLELGGKSPVVVFEDADLDSAVEGVVDAIWFTQG